MCFTLPTLDSNRRFIIITWFIIFPWIHHVIAARWVLLMTCPPGLRSKCTLIFSIDGSSPQGLSHSFFILMARVISVYSHGAENVPSVTFFVPALNSEFHFKVVVIKENCICLSGFCDNSSSRSSLQVCLLESLIKIILFIASVTRLGFVYWWTNSIIIFAFFPQAAPNFQYL